MKLVNLDQSGPAWHRWRSRGIGGSEAAVVVGKGFLSEEQLTQVKLGNTEVVENDRMARGKRLEPVARRLYTALTGIRVKPACAVHDTLRWYRASLDGITADRQLIIEIKCPSSRAHQKALDGAAPDYYYPQIMHNLGVTGAKVLHYVSYTDAETLPPEQRIQIIPYYPDTDYIEMLIEKERAYHERIRRLKKRGGGAR